MYRENQGAVDSDPGAAALSTSSRPTSFLQAIRTRPNPVLGAALTIPSTTVAQIVAQECDFVLIDMEHSPLGPELMTQMVHAVVSSSRGSCFPVVRVPTAGVEWIKWALDSGAAGIIIPMINTKKQAEEVIEQALFPPRGKRSFGPSRAPWALPDGSQGGVGTYFRRALSEEIAILPMIESAEGVKNVTDIVSISGVSGVFIGPMDLRMSLGLSGADGNEPVYKTSLDMILQAAKDHKKLVGTLGIGLETAKKRTQEGIDFLVVSTDAGVLSTGTDWRRSIS
ncbi:hypothetical protein NM208_g338 [Fusarium decemcellulare]|uniref:Uncharacterized protein n=1 Tax=Fusarium decemcellulare TaxID=57161 RepID=A0ACC1T029_9HYPO|nr:hypothetical protein NM208_g338 [Fusarium decemcellulare]